MKSDKGVQIKVAMDRKGEIRQAYKGLGGDRTFYDGMITCSTFMGKIVSGLVWNLDKEKTLEYQAMVLSNIPENFGGKLLEVPVGTGVITMPMYRTLPEAEITCLDYSPDMMQRAKRFAERLDIKNIDFIQGDVGNMPFEDESFEIVMSLNGFHAFPDKSAAYNETYRVLKPGGVFCGCFAVMKENKRTDWIIRNIYTPKGYCTPPFETAESLKKRLEKMYRTVKVDTVESIAVFRAVK
jgi:Methylase involved in ubiquinone/menaquinone biosynthesis